MGGVLTTKPPSLPLTNLYFQNSRCNKSMLWFEPKFVKGFIRPILVILARSVNQVTLR